MSNYSIGHAAEILGISTRTLRHWDHIGLVVPESRTWSDYRIYADTDIEKATQILIYREAGVPLSEIAEIMQAPQSATKHLEHQRELLMEKIAHLHDMIQAVDKIIKEKTMTIEAKITTLGKKWTDFHNEAKEQWGDTTEWKQSEERRESMSNEEWADSLKDFSNFLSDLGSAMEKKVKPGTPEGNALAARHRKLISTYYDCTPAKSVCLARMYIADDRFRQTYDVVGEKATEYLLSLVEAEAASQGVNLDMVTWND